jgi:hypothetical protein
MAGALPQDVVAGLPGASLSRAWAQTACIHNGCSHGLKDPLSF